MEEVGFIVVCLGVIAVLFFAVLGLNSVIVAHSDTPSKNFCELSKGDWHTDICILDGKVLNIPKASK